MEVEGVEADTSGRVLSEAIQSGKRSGHTARVVDLGQTAFIARRLRRNQQEGCDLVNRLPAASTSVGLKQAGPRAWERTIVAMAASHRPEPISVVVVRPTSGLNQRLVVISHGLWDSPGSFGSWAQAPGKPRVHRIASGAPGK